MMHPGIDFWKDFGRFLEEKWRHVGTKIASKIELSENVQNRIWSKPASAKLGSEVSSWDPKSKSIQNRSKFEVEDGVPLGIDFSQILVDSGEQIVNENGINIDTTTHR